MGTSTEGIPVLQQCKSGYMKNRIKPEQEMLRIKEALRENFDENHDIHKRPIVVLNKLDRGETLVTMTLDFYKELIETWITKK